MYLSSIIKLKWQVSNPKLVVHICISAYTFLKTYWSMTILLQKLSVSRTIGNYIPKRSAATVYWVAPALDAKYAIGTFFAIKIWKGFDWI